MVGVSEPISVAAAASATSAVTISETPSSAGAPSTSFVIGGGEDEQDRFLDIEDGPAEEEKSCEDQAVASGSSPSARQPLFSTPEPIDEEFLDGCGFIGDDGFLYAKSLLYGRAAKGGGEKRHHHLHHLHPHHLHPQRPLDGERGFGDDEYEDDDLVEMSSYDPLAYHRVNSTEILYENKKRKVKFVGHYLLGDVVGEGSYSKVETHHFFTFLC